MNILFILGNGFDLNLGLNTKYIDFYDWYKDQITNNKEIIKLKKEIDQNIENWSDLELALGQYTKNLDSDKNVYEVINDLREKLAIFLENEVAKKLPKIEFNAEELLNDFLEAENYLRKSDTIIIKKIKNELSQHTTNYIDIMTFNYTNTVELILDFSGKPIKINNSSFFRKVIHIHGSTKKRMVLGLNDHSQIDNQIFHKSIDVREALIKPECNKAIGDMIYAECKQLIASAHLIFIHGSSIGDTDKTWWEEIGERLKSTDKYLVIFEKVPDINPLDEFRKNSHRRKIKDKFLEKTKLNDKEKELIKDKIIVGINTDIFRGIIK